jgi:hypothetical protein
MIEPLEKDPTDPAYRALLAQAQAHLRWRPPAPPQGADPHPHVDGRGVRLLLEPALDAGQAEGRPRMS